MSFREPDHLPNPAVVRQIADALEPLLVPQGFAPAQGGGDARRAQVIFCRGATDSTREGGCADMVVDLEAHPEWRVVEVRYDGSVSWRLLPERDELAIQLDAIAGEIVGRLG